MVTAARIALATYERAPDLAPDDRLLGPALEALGIASDPVVWSRPADWERFDAVLIRSCWDYHLRYAEFRDWLSRLELAGIPVWNSPALVRWNADKQYLLDLAARGVSVVPTRRVAASGAEGARAVEAVVGAEGWRRFVVKPAISASGYETYALAAPLDSHARSAIARATAAGPTLVQPFVGEIERSGELSFSFIDGKPSHATLKRAAAGEFRVQTEHGGSVEPFEAPARLVEHAAAILASLPETPLYARVDGVERDGAFVLMELELIEPNLFLGCSSGAADVLSRAVERRLPGRAG